jgi:hypothetical protein
MGVQEGMGHMEIMGIGFWTMKMKVGRGDEELKS